jgi:CRP-like cAMP-binding protein
MTPEEILATILQISFLRTLPEQLRHQVAGILEETGELRQVPKSAAWLREHEQGKNLGYLLLKGQAKVEKTDAPEIICRAPELLGEMMQFNPAHERTASVTALEDCVVMQFSWDAFWEALQAKCPEADQKKVRSALEEVAWRHVTG